MLCHGYERAGGELPPHVQASSAPGIPGIISTHPNEHVASLRSPAWSRLLSALGKGADRIMIDLLLDCGIFVSVPAGVGNFYQLSGTSLKQP